MSYASGSIILEYDFNIFADKINSIYGDTNQGSISEGVADVGYGISNTTPNVSQGNVITSSEWTSLLDTIYKVTDIQGLTPSAVLPTSVLTGEIITAYEGSQGLLATLDLLFVNRHDIDASHLVTTTSGAKIQTSRDFAWTGSIEHEFTVTFANWNEIRYFFNTAGEVIISGAKTGGTEAANVNWENIFTSLGDIKFRRNTTTSDVTTANIGFYDLTSTYQNVQSVSDGNSTYALAAKLDGSPGTAAGLIFKATFSSGSLIDGVITHDIDQTIANSASISVTEPTYTNLFDFDDVNTNIDPIITINIPNAVDERTYNYVGDVTIQNIFAVTTESVLVNAVEYFFTTDPIDATLESVIIKDVVQQGDLKITKDPNDIAAPRVVTFNAGDIDDLLSSDTFEFTYRVIDTDTDTHEESKTLTINSKYPTWSSHKSTGLTYAEDVEDPSLLEVQILQSDTPVVNEKYGQSISSTRSFDEKVFVGADGYVDIYEKDDTTVNNAYDRSIFDTLTPSNPSGVNSFGSKVFANSVANAGDDIFYYAFVSDPENTEAPWTNQGAVYPFSWNDVGQVWQEEPKLIPIDIDDMDNFGFSLSASSVTVRDGLQEAVSTNYSVAIGAPNKTSGSFVDLGAVYVFSKIVTDYTAAGLNSWSQQKLEPTNKIANLHFGYDVACDEQRLYTVVGSNADGAPGKAYIFKNTTTWQEEKELVPSDSATNDKFGKFVAISNTGEFAIVGNEAGAMYVFKNNSGQWDEEAKITPADNNAINAVKFANEFDDNTTPYIVCSSIEDNEGDTQSGAAYIFDRNITTGVWTEREKFKPSYASTNLQMGSSLEFAYINFGFVHTATLYASALGFDTSTVNDTGGVFTYEFRSNDSPVIPDSEGNQTGKTLGISGDGTRMVIGSPNRDKNGVAYVYDRNVSTWDLNVELNYPISGTSSYSKYGEAVAISDSGNTFVVCGPEVYNDSNESSGAAYVYEYNTGIWNRTLLPMPAVAPVADDRFGDYCAVSRDGSVIVIGCPKYNTSGTDDAGAAFVYEKSGDEWILKSTLFGFTGSRQTTITPRIFAYEEFGCDASISGVNNEFICIGNRRYEGGNYNSGAVCVYSTINALNYDPLQFIEIPGADNEVGTEYGSKVKLARDSNDLVVLSPNSSPAKDSAVYVYRISSNGFYSSTPTQKIGGAPNGSGGLLYTDVSASHDGRDIFIADSGRFSSNRSATTYVYHRSGLGTTWNISATLVPTNFHGLDENQVTNAPVVDFANDNQYILVGSPQETQDGANTPQGGYYGYYTSINEVAFSMSSSNAVDSIVAGTVAVNVRSNISNEKVYFIDNEGVRTEYNYSGNVLIASTPLGEFTFNKSTYPVTVSWDAASGNVSNNNPGRLEYVVTNDLAEQAFDFIDLTLSLRSAAWINETLSFPESIGLVLHSFNSTISSDGTRVAVDFDTPVDGQAGFFAYTHIWNESTKEWDLETNTQIGSSVYNIGDDAKHHFSMSLNQNGEYFATSVLNENNTVQNQGGVYVLKYNTNISQHQVESHLTIPSVAPNADNTDYGYAIDISEDASKLVVTAPKFEPSGFANKVGSVFVYERSGNVWNQVQQLDPPGADDISGLRFGEDVKFASGTGLIFVGSSREFMYVYEYSTGLGYTLKTKVTLNDTDAAARRIATDFSGDYVAIGDRHRDNDPTVPAPTAVYTNKSQTDGIGDDITNDVFVDEDGVIYVSTIAGLSISTDGGTSFSNKTTADGLPSNSVRRVFGIGGTMWAATSAGLGVSTDSGVSWSAKTTANGLGSNDVNDVHSHDGSIVCVATEAGLSVSEDFGNTFVNRTTANGLINNECQAVFVDERNWAWVGISSTGDDGVSVSASPASGVFTDVIRGVYSISDIAVRDYVVYFTEQNDGVFIVDYYGRTVRNSDAANNGLVSDVCKNIYVTEIGDLFVATQAGIALSRDFGETWIHRDTSNGMAEDNCSGVYVDENNKVYLSTTGFPDGGLTIIDDMIDFVTKNVGTVSIYKRSGNVWNYSDTKAPIDYFDNEHFGASVEISGNSKVLFIGSPGAEQVNEDFGAWYAYKLSGAGNYDAVRLKATEQQIAANTFDFDQGVSNNFGFGEKISTTADGTRMIMQRVGDTGIFGVGGYPYILDDLPVQFSMSSKEIYDRTIENSTPYAHVKLNERDSSYAVDQYYNVTGRYTNVYASVQTVSDGTFSAPPGLNDKCISYAEADDAHIRLGNVDGSQLQSSFSIMGWYLKEPTGTEAFSRYFEFADSDATPQNAFFLAQNATDNTSLYMNVRTAGTSDIVFDVSNVIDTSIWQFIVITYTAGTYRLYVNSSEVAVSSGSVPPNIEYEFSKIGSGTADSFNGKMSHFSIVKEALTPATIDQLYTLGYGFVDGKTYITDVDVSIPDSNIQEEKLVVTSVANPTPQEFFYSGNILTANVDAGTITIDKSANPRTVTFDVSPTYGGEHTFAYSVEDTDGGVYVDSDNWLVPDINITTVQHYIPPNTVIVGALGASVAISDDLSRVFAGAPLSRSDSSGSVYDFDLNINDPQPLTFINGGRYYETDTRGAGRSVSTNSDASRVIVGAPDGQKSEWRVYNYPSTEINTFSHDSIIINSDTTETSGFTSDMTPDGTRIVYGTANDDDAGNPDSGVITIRVWDGNDYGIQEAQFTSQAPEVGDRLGHAVTISDAGDVVATIAVNEFAVYIYRRTGATWAQEDRIVVTDDIAISAVEDVEISGDGTTIAVLDKGAGSNNNKGIVFYRYEGGSWVYKSYTELTGCKGGGILPEYRNAISLSTDGHRFVVGAHTYEVTVALFTTYKGGIIVGDDTAGDASSWRLTPHTFHDWSADPANAAPGYSVDMTPDGRWVVVGDPSDENGNVSKTSGAILLVRID